MNLSPVVNQKYITGTMGDTFARARRREIESVEEFQRRIRHVCVWDGGGGGEKDLEHNCTRARSGVEGGSSSNWIIWQTSDR
jgi:hypothetical protein